MSLSQESSPRRRRGEVARRAGGGHLLPIAADRSRLDLALAQSCQSLVDVSLAGLGRLAIGDRQHQALLLAVGQTLEHLLRPAILVKRLGEVVGQGELARLLIELEIDVDGIAGCDPRIPPVLVANTDHELAAHHRHRAAIGVVVDGDPYKRHLAGAERLNHPWWNLNARRGLTGSQDLGSKPHVTYFARPGGCLGRIHSGRHPGAFTKHLQAWWLTGGGSAGEDLRPHPRLCKTRSSSRPDSLRPSPNQHYKTPAGAVANRRGFRGGGLTSFPAPLQDQVEL